ncbi:hypothetical protein GJU41_22520 [Bacillus idriensis]|uniref:Uncharacterized protein n=1 Tax=Metabacillus idriensis TaxID=324768 RepID=A0A6I2MJI0_9BACI|nr:hypothetical protein [Metabacillus idriensis]MRX56721.1 hypothetical protein [Metabacillus idriensis]
MNEMKTWVIKNTIDFLRLGKFDQNLSDEVKEPMILFIDENNEIIESFNLISKTKEEINLMVDDKYFYTSSLDIGQTRTINGLYHFYGTTFERVYG